jgi:DNA cross-link repair 1C protein
MYTFFHSQNAHPMLTSIRFLIEGPKGAVLHTGDFRAEPHFLNTIKRNPFLQPYIAPTSSSFSGSSNPISKTLESIYLDTACVFSDLHVPTKEQATEGLVEMMDLFPRDVSFFINSWTWGYEDLFKAISWRFGSKVRSPCFFTSRKRELITRYMSFQIHVDRYKYSIYTRITDPFLASIVTLDSTSTRFHACERFDRCDQVATIDDHANNKYGTTSVTGKQVVYVNMLRMDMDEWETYTNDVKRRVASGEAVKSLVTLFLV